MKRTKSEQASCKSGTAVFTKKRILYECAYDFAHVHHMKRDDILIFSETIFRDHSIAVFQNGNHVYVVRDGGFRVWHRPEKNKK